MQNTSVYVICILDMFFVVVPCCTFAPKMRDRYRIDVAEKRWKSAKKEQLVIFGATVKIILKRGLSTRNQFYFEIKIAILYSKFTCLILYK